MFYLDLVNLIVEKETQFKAKYKELVPIANLIASGIQDMQRQLNINEQSYEVSKLYVHLKGLFVLFVLHDPVVHKVILTFGDSMVKVLTENPYSEQN